MISEGTSLLSLVAALVGLTLLVGGSVAIVEAAFAGADREPAEQALAQAYSEQTIAYAETETRSQVLRASQLSELNRSILGITGPPPGIDIRLDGTRLYHTGDAVDGTTIRRLVLIETGRTISRTAQALTIPTGVGQVTVTAAPGTTIRADGRVVVGDTGGTNQTIRLNPTTATTLRTDSRESITAYYDSTVDRTAVLSVTVEVDE